MSFSYDQDLISKGYSYQAYRKLLNDKMASPDANEQEQKLRPYTEKNIALMQQFDLSYRVGQELLSALQAAPPAYWLVLTEGWCGDAAYSGPLFNAIAEAAPDKVELRFLLRDSNEALMDAHLTDGGRSIPKLIVLSRDLKELATWGPRPAALSELMKGWKAEGLQLGDLIRNSAAWYLADDTKTTQAELEKMVSSY